ncbi:DnaJ C-terminal domain-containing protein [Streptomyces buecherae]|uniref:DnaJ C-terminal domain-containing protein n=1 Tax=Streptomyces buecherae TaxID=2763006 RepID=UPI003F5424B1
MPRAAGRRQGRPRAEGKDRLVHEQRTDKVHIPAGSKDGQAVLLRELGGPGAHGGTSGDLYATMPVAD